MPIVHASCPDPSVIINNIYANKYHWNENAIKGLPLPRQSQTHIESSRRSKLPVWISSETGDKKQQQSSSTKRNNYSLWMSSTGGGKINAKVFIILLSIKFRSSQNASNFFSTVFAHNSFHWKINRMHRIRCKNTFFRGFFSNRHRMNCKKIIEKMYFCIGFE